VVDREKGVVDALHNHGELRRLLLDKALRSSYFRNVLYHAVHANKFAVDHQRRLGRFHDFFFLALKLYFGFELHLGPVGRFEVHLGNQRAYRRGQEIAQRAVEDFLLFFF